RQLHRRGLFVTPTLIVGINEEGRALAEHLAEDPGSMHRVIGFIDCSGQSAEATAGDLPVLGGLSDAKQVVEAWQVGEVIVAPTALTREELLDLYRIFALDSRVELRFSSGLFEILTTGVTVEESSCVPLVTPRRVRITGVDAALKAAMDYAAALAGLIALGPVLAVVALFVKIDSP